MRTWRRGRNSCAAITDDAKSGLVQPGEARFSLTTHVAAGVEAANAATGTHVVCDAAGNCATAGPIGGHKVDKKPPEIVVISPQPNSTYIVGQSVAALYTCSDAGSGLANCGGPFPSGGFLDTSATRDATFTVNALDRVGNATSLSTSYGVTYQIRVLYDEENTDRKICLYSKSNGRRMARVNPLNR